MISRIMPSSVAWFERLSYLSLLVGLDATILFYPRVNAYGRATWPDVSDMTVLSLYLLGLEIFVGFYGWLIWLAARRRRNWAVWLIVALTLLGMLLSQPIFMQVLELRDIADALKPCITCTSNIGARFAFRQKSSHMVQPPSWSWIDSQDA